MTIDIRFGSDSGAQFTESEIEAKKVKLVIWDLDETLWHGTLSEEEVTLVEGRAEFIQKLARSGILNSICSKNDYKQTKTKLQELGLWEYFIFPAIAWVPKGQAIQQILKYAKLRPENTLFIDDNASNAGEVQFYNPGIKIIHPNDLKSFPVKALKENDPSMERLKNYKLLEKKELVRKEFTGTNEEFLKQSNVKLVIAPLLSTEENADRVLSLINRTNQLNFTKKRYPGGFAELINYLRVASNINLKIYASDNYGDYGLIGFVSIDKEWVVRHFLFSCRILDLGIEKAVYRFIKSNYSQTIFPFDISGLDDDVDWIHLEEKQNYHEKPRVKGASILFSGLCEAEAISSFLDNEYEIFRATPTPLGSVRQALRYRFFKPILNGYFNLLFKNTFDDFDDSTFTEEVHKIEEFKTGRYKYLIYPIFYEAFLAIPNLPLFSKMPIPGLFFWKFLPEIPQYQEYIKHHLNNDLEIHGMRVKKTRLKFFDDRVFKRYCKLIKSKSISQLNKDLRWLLSIIPNKSKLLLINIPDCGKYIPGQIETVSQVIHQRVDDINRMVDVVVAENIDKVRLIDLRKHVGVDDINDLPIHLSRNAYFRIASQIREVISQEKV